MPQVSKFELRLDIVDAKAKLASFTEGLRTAADTAREATRAISEVLLRHLRIEAPVGTYYDLDGTSYEGGTLRDSLDYKIRQGLVSGGGFASLSGGLSRMGTTPGGSVEGTVSEFRMLSHGKYTLPPGTVPHPIFPRSAPFLTFYWPRIQSVVRSKEIEHPGYAGDPWDARALGSAYPEMKSIWLEAFNQWRVKITERVTYH